MTLECTVFAQKGYIMRWCFSVMTLVINSNFMAWIFVTQSGQHWLVDQLPMEVVAIIIYKFNDRSSFLSIRFGFTNTKTWSLPLYKPITYFYHVTKLLPKVNITLTDELCGSVVKMTRLPSSQSPIHGKLSSVFFGCNLDKRDDCSLPDTSPFGTERVKIPITKFASSKFHLFYNSHHKTQDTVYYVILVLIKESDPKYGYCKDRMIELDMESNRILQLDFQRNKFEYCHPIGFRLWLEVFVVGNIPLGDISHSWDNVTDTGRHQSGPCVPRQGIPCRGIPHRCNYHQRIPRRCISHQHIPHQRIPHQRYRSTFDDFDDPYDRVFSCHNDTDDVFGY